MLIAVIAFLILAWSCGFWILFRVPPFPEDGPAIDPSLVSAIIPARDEETRIPALLESLRAGRIQPLEIIVVDDHSRDRTAEISRGLGARVIPAPPLPGGWTGKTWACWNGSLEARGTHLLFLDADLAFEPEGLERILRLPASEPGVHSISPFHRVLRPYESLSAFFHIVMVAGTNAFTPLGDRAPSRGLFGQSLLVRKEDYLLAGGHAAVKGRILENFFLARRFAAEGIETHCRLGRGVLSMRMFPEGLGSLVRGWSKAFASGAGATSLAALVPIAIWLAGAATVAFFGPWLAAAGHAALAAASYFAYAAQIALHLRRVGSYPLIVAIAYPVPLIFFFAVFFRSALGARRGRPASWKGRDVVDGA